MLTLYFLFYTHLKVRESYTEMWVFPSGHRDTGHLQQKPSYQANHFKCAQKQALYTLFI